MKEHTDDLQHFALLDGDEFLYKATRSCMVESNFNDEIQLTTDMREVKRVIADLIEEIREELDVEGCHIALSGDGDQNFRKFVFSKYKGNRRETRKPVGFHQAKEWMQEEYVCFHSIELEADDILGLRSELYGWCVSSDKDMKTVPGRWYDPYHDARYTIDEEQADWHFLFQTLTGDTTDGYPGAKGIGVVKAERILAKAAGCDGRIPAERFDDCWAAVVAAFPTELQAIQQARCARILRPGEYLNGEPVLWYPGELYHE